MELGGDCLYRNDFEISSALRLHPWYKDVGNKEDLGLESINALISIIANSD